MKPYNRILSGIIVGMVLAVGSAVPSARASDDNECSNATLRGSYGFHEEGTIFAQGLQGRVGVDIFDGKGTWSTSQTVVNQTLGVSHVSGTGTYTVNPDCTGSVGSTTMHGSADFVIVEGGNEFFAISTRGDRVSSSIAVRSARARDDNECSNATLRGSYAFHAEGTIFAQGLVRSGGVFIFDGEGNLSVSATFVNQTLGVRHISSTGTYAVNPDCTGSAVTTSSGSGDFVIVEGGNEIFLISTRSDRVAAWDLKKQFLRAEDSQNN